MTEDRRPIASLHVDTDHPSVIKAEGMTVWIDTSIGDDGERKPPVVGQALGPEWREVGFTTEGVQIDEDDQHEIRSWDDTLVRSSFTTVTASLEVEKADLPALAALLGLSDELAPHQDEWPRMLTPLEQRLRQRQAERAMRDRWAANYAALTYGWVDYRKPPPAPRKRKGLTGKAYRIARRQHARLVKRLRGLPPVHYTTHLPRVKVDADRTGPDGIGGHRVHFIVDEAAGFGE